MRIDQPHSDIGLEQTAQAPSGTRDDSVPPLAAGTEDTAAAPSSAGPLPVHYARTARRIFGVAAVLSTAWLLYFIVRFLVAGDPPQLHKSFIGKSGGAFESLSIFDGPYLTLVRMIVVSASYVAIATWASRAYRYEVRVQAIAAIASVFGQYSLAVAVLTSSETAIAARATAALIYVALPAATFATGALFPSGRPVPRWSLYVVPMPVLLAAAQAVVMFREREYSVPLAAALFPFMAFFFACQWHRYRKHATTRERSQIKWLCYATGAFVTIQAIAVIALIPLLDNRESAAFPFVRILFELMLGASYLVGLACLLFSGARYRVWDIDRVINRTIVYAIVTVLLGGASIVAFFGLRALFAGAVPSVAGIAISLAIVIAFAAPLRRRIARWIDRRFYGIGLDYEALAKKAVHAEHRELPVMPEGRDAFASYDELRLLGRGGMGAVYRAHHADFGVPVALKVMSPQLAGDADAQARFRRESQILEDLQHPNIVPYLAAGHEAGVAYIAMQYIDGEDLHALVRARGKLSIAEAAPLITQIAAALELAHARGVIHRDIKPANVLVEGAPSDPLAKRRALVMDFGVARLADDPRAPVASLVGSLPYIAPEQIQNADAVDARADVYSLGATAYELVTGRPPFVDDNALGLVLAHLNQPPADPRTFAPELPEGAAKAILRALAKEPAQRYATAPDFAAALTR